MYLATSVEAAESLAYAGLTISIGISLAIVRRFWAVAARMNSSCAPFGLGKPSDVPEIVVTGLSLEPAPAARDLLSL
jgi:hypothetical protein